ncbi:MAG: hypothetical protein R3E86_06220 [Pseudomonadales bacterium]
MEEFKDWVGGGDEIPREQLETFGITMATLKDQGVDALGGAGQLISALTLEVATNARQPTRSIGGLSVPLTRIMFSPPGMVAGGASRAKFTCPVENVESSDCYGKIYYGQMAGSSATQGAWEGPLYGVIEGRLYANNLRKSDGRASMVEFQAEFYAAETAFGCQFQ